MRFLAVALPLLFASVPNGGEADALRGEVARLMVELDSDEFDLRVQAAKRLEELVGEPELGPFLAKEFQRALLSTDVSFEVRRRLERWRHRLPAVPPEPVGKVSPADLDKLVRQLNDDCHAVRMGAAERLDWMLGDAKLVYPLMERFKRYLADERSASTSRHPIDAAWRKARQVWLTNEEAGKIILPKVSDRQIEGWLDNLSGSGRSGKAAERELSDLLARDDYVPLLKRMLGERLARSKNDDESERLRALLDWTKPAMVAEYWHRRRNLGQQHLLIGVPSLGANAIRPSYFDRIDDRDAHCVSGQNLSPGDYPVGVAFPHPNVEGAFFHLINLSTPRRRMAYPYRMEIDESKRLAAISRRTLQRILSERRRMLESELVMLEGLDASEVSRFAGKYFLLVEDGSTVATGPPRWGGRPSRFGMICARLAIDGTKESMPGLAEAIAKDRFMPPTPYAQYKLHLIAALSIAVRDPWPTADRWLADCIESDEPLRVIEDDFSKSARLGATAAAILLRRHDQSPRRLGLSPAADPLLNQIQLKGYRFSGEEGKKKVQAWWKDEKDKQKTP
ncbi:MAG: hypothetical protein JW959_08180 [Pirellulales bacterium]|nr:hypothetical protein [Pirellulales bacterium]